MPAHHGFRRDDDERLLPFRPESEYGNPEYLVNDAKVRALASPLQHSKLLAKHQVFHGEVGASAKQLKE